MKGKWLAGGRKKLGPQGKGGQKGKERIQWQKKEGKVTRIARN